MKVYGGVQLGAWRGYDGFGRIVISNGGFVEAGRRVLEIVGVIGVAVGVGWY